MAAVSVLRNVFVYGSLLAPEVVDALLHRTPTSTLAVVRDFHRYSVKGRLYPAALPAKGSEVTGKDSEGLDDLNISIASPLKASIYVWANLEDKDLYGSWDYEMWRTKHLAEFLENYFGVSNVAGSVEAGKKGDDS